MLASLLDNLYGVWFLPQQTLRTLRSQPQLGQAVLVVAVLNLVDTGRRQGFGVSELASSILWGVAGWLCLSALLSLLAYSCGKTSALREILVLSGFAGIPWLLLAPAQAMGGVAGVLLALAALGWFLYLQVQAVAVALDLSWQRLVLLIPLAFASIFVVVGWIGSGLRVLASLG
ncbi:MAG: hypothetical protein HC921_20880 [Synechococcaceae cyanobacterium SM2_3_1]|nr:hypothetical protein [Synechococcaceae cyanobacterium SM2_3_1]